VKPLSAAAIVALWIVTCLSAWITLGLTLLNTEAWWVVGFFITGGAITAPIVTYNMSDG